MAAARLNIPSIFVSGGPMLPDVLGRAGQSKQCFYGAGSGNVGRMTPEELDLLEEVACPGCGSCSGMFTANSMNCLTEALGKRVFRAMELFLAVHAARIRLAKQAGMKIMELLEKDIKPLDIMTREAFENALILDMAIGCSSINPASLCHCPRGRDQAGSGDGQ